MNISAFIPEIIVLAGACTILLLGIINFPYRKLVLWVLGLLVPIIALIALLTSSQVIHPAGTLFTHDGFAIYSRALLLIVSTLVLLSSFDMFTLKSKHQDEFIFMLLTSCGGLMLLVGASHMLVVYLAIELASIPLYILAGFKYKDIASKEAVVKYFLLGAFASALTIYGISLIFSTTASLAFSELLVKLSGTPLEIVGIVLLLAGLSFKIAAFPFHFWAPDVYEGAPTISTAFISVAPKIGALVVLARFVGTGVGNTTLLQIIGWVVAGISAFSMTFGNVAALWQTEVKRIMAYSSIAQIGYMLIAIVAIALGKDVVTKSYGAYGILIYVTAYALMNIAVFSILNVVRKKYGGSTLDHFKGLSKQEPVLCILMTIAMISLLGVPWLAGFWGKFSVFGAAITGEQFWIVILAVVNSGISAFYYFGIVRAMYLEEREEPSICCKTNWSMAQLSAIICSIGTIIPIGLIPQLYEALKWASNSLFRIGG